MLAVYLLASNMRGPVAAAEYAQALEQEELKLLGAWRRNGASTGVAPRSRSAVSHSSPQVCSSVVMVWLTSMVRPFVSQW